jgi:ribosomal-protein-serine acetyltransferase
LIERRHRDELFKLIDSNRKYWRQWHPWLPDTVRSAADAERLIAGWLQQFANNRGFCAGVWFQGRLCGMIYHLHVDWANRSTDLSYWLDEAHQGKGIMTASCRAFVSHAFNTWKLNRITIQCATQNTRSRAIPERLGFKFEGIVRETEWLYDHYVDHALYGLLRSDQADADAREAYEPPPAERGAGPCDAGHSD